MKRQFRNKMNILNFKQEGINLLESVDIKVDGTRPWDIKILSDKTYSRVFRDGTLGFGEAYLNGEWECRAESVTSPGFGGVLAVLVFVLSLGVIIHHNFKHCQEARRLRRR